MCITHKMRTADLYCGGGGSAEGLSKHVDLVLGVDHDPNALECYRMNHPNHEAIEMDLSETRAVIRLLKKRRIELVTGSPPCTDFSNAGNRIEGARAGLTSKFADIVVGCGAKGAIVENVPEVLSSNAFHEFEAKLLAAGFHLVSFVIDASKVGVPQRRRRAFVIATRGSLDSLRPILQASQDLANAPVTTPNEVIPKIGKWLLTTPCNKSSPAVVPSDQPAPTLRTGCGSRINKRTYQPRTRDAGPIEEATELSVKQLGMLSGFPRRYKWPNVRSHAGRVIGNAVCPPVMDWVVRHALPAFSSIRPPKEEPTHLKPDPPARQGTTFRRTLFVLGLAQDAEPDAATLSGLARRAGIHVFRTRPSLVLRYTYGTNETTDANTRQITQGFIRRGWTLEIRERGVATNCTDDLYWIINTGQDIVRYRSIRELEKAGLV